MKGGGRKGRVRVREENETTEAKGKMMQLTLNIEGRHKSGDVDSLWKLGKPAKTDSSIETSERNVP